MSEHMRGALDDRLEVVEGRWGGEGTPPPSTFSGPIQLWEPRDLVSPREPKFRYQLPTSDARHGSRIQTVSVTGALLSHAIGIDERTGVIVSWKITGNGNSDFEILNRGPGYHSGIQPWMDWTDDYLDGQVTRHQALFGGPFYARSDVDPKAYWFGNPTITIEQSRVSMPALQSDGTPIGSDTEQVTIAIRGKAMELDPDGTFSKLGVSTYHGGARNRPVIWKALDMVLLLTVNHQGYEGLHKLEVMATPSFDSQGFGFDFSVWASLGLNRGAFPSKKLAFFDPGISGWSAGEVVPTLTNMVPYYSGIDTTNRWDGASDTTTPSFQFNNFTAAFTQEPGTAEIPLVAIAAPMASPLERTLSEHSLDLDSRPSEIMLLERTDDADTYEGGNMMSMAFRRSLSSRWHPQSGARRIRNRREARCRSFLVTYPRQDSGAGTFEADGVKKLALATYLNRL